MDQARRLFGDLTTGGMARRHRQLDFAEEIKYEEALAISIVCFMLSMVALSSIYRMCKSRRSREGMGYREVERPENAFEMMSLGGRDGVTMVLPQGY